MYFLQPPLSSATSRKFTHVSSSPRRSSQMVSGHFSLGLPLPRFPPGSQFITCLVLLAMWPSHVSLFLPMMQPSSSCLVLSLILLFVILSLHNAISSSAICDALPPVSCRLLLWLAMSWLHGGLGGIVGLTLPMARAVRVPYTTSPCSDLGQVVNLSLSVA